MKSIWDLVVIIGATLLLAGLILPRIFHHPHEHSHRKGCNSNLGQIVKAMCTYQEPNGDCFPAFWDGTRFDPMASMAMLYPAYLDNPKVFGCTETKDRPKLTLSEGTKGVGRGFGPVNTDRKCSYFYDELSHFRTIAPLQAMACDADGQTWRDSAGKPPPYPATWQRKPAAPNHENGQNVMFFDGHVKWYETAYASADPADNIFCPNGTTAGPWGADTDAYLWDGVNARALLTP